MVIIVALAARPAVSYPSPPRRAGQLELQTPIDSATAMLLLRLFAIGGLLNLLLCPVSCLARRRAPPSPSNDDNYYCDWCPRHSTASADLDALLRGNGSSVCGAAAAELDGGAPHVAAVGADFFFRDGAGCGACYQLRCTDLRVCSDGGVKVVVVAGAANRTGFLLTREAVAAMARPGISSDDQMLHGLGGNAVQVDFRRIPCDYKNKNLSVRIEKQGSKHPAHLAISFLYQGGQTDIAAVEIAQAAADGATAPVPSWRPMARMRRRGVVTWRTSRAPVGSLQLRLVVTAGVGGKWLRAGGDVPVLPADWRPGQVHDTGLRVRDVALSTCYRSCRVLRPVVGGGEELYQIEVELD